jgi:hypothetical protein
MNPRIVFGLSALMSLLGSVVFARYYLWARLADKDRREGLLQLVTPHLFFRFIGLSFLVPGVVSPSLPAEFAIPAAFGDLGAGILAIIATVGLAKRASWAIATVWIFNVWGAADLLFAIYQGPRLGIEAGDFGAAFFIPTAIVPPLLITHALVFKLLLRRER